MQVLSSLIANYLPSAYNIPLQTSTRNMKYLEIYLQEISFLADKEETPDILQYEIHLGFLYQGIRTLTFVKDMPQNLGFALLKNHL